MRAITITVPADVRTAATTDLEVLLRDYGDEGHGVMGADVRATPGGIWMPAEFTEEYS